ncbi:MAG: hypothetical protein WBA87_15640 [Microbacterium sp.]
MRQEIQRLWSALRKVSKATLQNGSIGRAGIRVYDGGWIRIEDGGLSVTGTQTVTGRLEGDGEFDWSGEMNITGPWDLNGNGDIAGSVNLTGSMAVKSGGSITVQGGGGNVVLSSDYGSPRINLGGAQIDGGTSLTFTAGTTTVYFTGGTIRISGMPTKPQSAYPGSFPGAVVADPSGNFYRITA